MVRLTAKQLKRLQVVAARNGMKPSQYMRYLFITKGKWYVSKHIWIRSIDEPALSGWRSFLSDRGAGREVDKMSLLDDVLMIAIFWMVFALVHTGFYLGGLLWTWSATPCLRSWALSWACCWAGGFYNRHYSPPFIHELSGSLDDRVPFNSSSELHWDGYRSGGRSV